MGDTTLTVGIGGPAPLARSALVRVLSEALRDHYDVAIVAGDDAADATARLMRRSPGLEVLLVEWSGDDFTAMARSCDLTLCVVDARAASKTDACIAQADLLVIDKAGEMIEPDVRKVRAAGPFVFTNLETGEGLERVVDFIETDGLLDEATPDG